MQRFKRVIRLILIRRLPRSVIVVAGTASFLAGVAGAYWQMVSFGWLLVVVVPCLALAFRRQAALFAASLAVTCFIVGSYHGSAYMQRVRAYDELAKHTVTIIARASDDAVYGDKSQLTFTVDTIELAEPYRGQLPGNMSIKGFGLPAVTRGDIVQVSGKLYRSRGNNFAGISFGKLQMVKASTSPWEAARRKFVAGMQTALPEPAASFGLGLLIGQRSTLPEENADELRMVGLTHIIAVSGANLTILVEVCRRWLGRLSKFQNTMVCLALIGAFLFVTGLSPPIVRAAIISGIGLAAWYYGRSINPFVLLLTGAAITLGMNPSYIWGNVSWYLSFLAFFGVLVVAPLITRRLYKRKEPGIVAAVLIESLAASLVTVPYILYIFGQTSTVVLLANLLVVPFIPLAMLFSLIAGVAGVLLPALAGWLAWPGRIVLTYMLDIAALLSRVPHAFIEHIGFGLGALCFSYSCLLFVCFILWRHERRAGKCAIITDKKYSTNE